ncbi:MAG: gamma-glutamylcyclotransferase [Proteobacteria bacterium]|nr:gamma-glutamylcyclotransferase [Pseudomonadota bacterium]
MVPANPERLFVYGTLRPGMSNAHYLQGIHGTWINATISAVHLPEGYGATIGYPVLVPTAKGQAVHGQILEAHFTQADWRMLDDFETDAYERVLLPVQTDQGAELLAWVYVLNAADAMTLRAERPKLFDPNAV